jgi:hypothetical protein
MYGCTVQNAPEETRIYPFLLSKLCPFFSFSYSRFGIQKSKEATSRVNLFKELKIPNVFTMESSFCGNDEGPYAGYHFTIENLEQAGRDFSRTLLVYSDIYTPPELENLSFEDFNIFKKNSEEDADDELDPKDTIETERKKSTNSPTKKKASGSGAESSDNNCDSQKDCESKVSLRKSDNETG